ncbi:MAG: hypothetical protein GC182_05540 [Rhodopseudomonas sp.]|nr:hypothetical protein [Rhodopseudomonas sp.]
MRFTYYAIILSVLTTSTELASAQTLQQILNIGREQNPIAESLAVFHKCELITPPSDFLVGKRPGAGTPGTILVPVRDPSDKKTWDFSGIGAICPVMYATEDFPPAVKDVDKTGIRSSIGFKEEISASVKLTIGKWLKILDFDASKIQQLGIWLSTDDSVAFADNIGKSVRAIRKEYGPDCPATSDPKLYSRAKIVERACVGKITVSLVAKKEMSLNAFDLTFSQFAVGLKASWKRDTVGAASDCTVDASGLAESSTPKAASSTTSNAGAADATKDKPSTDKPAAGGLLVSITEGTIDATYKGEISPDHIMSKPTPKQISNVTSKSATPTEKPKPTATADKPQTATPTEGDKPAATQPAGAKQTTTCAKNVVYQTVGNMVLGVHMRPAGDYLRLPANNVPYQPTKP